jgi:hypothetical protein
MPHWLIKSRIQRAISWLPASAWWNELFQRYITRSVLLGRGGFDGKVATAAKFLDRFRRHQPLAPGDFTAFEVGTGWYPTLPICFYLCGASEVHSFDIVSHLSRDRLALLLNYFCAAADDGMLQRVLPGVRPERLERLRALHGSAQAEVPAETLKKIGVHVHVGDASNSGRPAGSADLVFTCGVLEYVPRPILPKLLAEFRRVASKRSATVHWVNLSDEFAIFDSSIGPFNFLQYPEPKWRRLESPLISNNRHRIRDYRELIAKAGFVMKAEENELGRIEDLKRIQPAPEFQGYTTEDLLVLESLFTAVPAERA